MGTLSNIDIADFRRFLKFQSWEYAGTKGGHEKWCKKGMLRPVIFQTHIAGFAIPDVCRGSVPPPSSMRLHAGEEV